MANSLYNSIGNRPAANISDFLTNFNNFRSTFNANPQTQVQQLIQSGRMTQAQFQQYAQIANQLRPFIK